MLHLQHARAAGVRELMSGLLPQACSLVELPAEVLAKIVAACDVSSKMVRCTRSQKLHCMHSLLCSASNNCNTADALSRSCRSI